MKKRVSKLNSVSSGDDWYPTDEEFLAFKPIAAIDPALLNAHKNGTLKKRGRPSLEKKKKLVSVRLDPEILAALKASGKGWQAHLNLFLYKAIVEGKRISF